MKFKYCAYAAVIAVSILLIFAGMNQGSASYTINSRTQSQKFTANGTFTVPSNINTFWVTMSGAGGGGGGGTSGAGNSAGGQGGGSGEYIFRQVIVIGTEASVPITVGEAGAGGAAGMNGINGGNSSFGAYIKAEGGRGGRIYNSSLSGSGGGVLGGTNFSQRGISLLNVLGGSSGGANTSLSISGANSLLYRGGNASGTSAGGSGAAGAFGNGADAENGGGATNGASALANTGAGGGGGSAGTWTGGNGGSGLIIIEWVG